MNTVTVNDAAIEEALAKKDLKPGDRVMLTRSDNSGVFTSQYDLSKDHYTLGTVIGISKSGNDFLVSLDQKQSPSWGPEVMALFERTQIHSRHPNKDNLVFVSPNAVIPKSDAAVKMVKKQGSEVGRVVDLLVRDGAVLWEHKTDDIKATDKIVKATVIGAEHGGGEEGIVVQLHESIHPSWIRNVNDRYKFIHTVFQNDIKNNLHVKNEACLTQAQIDTFNKLKRAELEKEARSSTDKSIEDRCALHGLKIGQKIYLSVGGNSVNTYGSARIAEDVIEGIVIGFAKNDSPIAQMSETTSPGWRLATVSPPFKRDTIHSSFNGKLDEQQDNCLYFAPSAAITEEKAKSIKDQKAILDSLKLNLKLGDSVRYFDDEPAQRNFKIGVIESVDRSPFGDIRVTIGGKRYPISQIRRIVDYDKARNYAAASILKAKIGDWVRISKDSAYHKIVNLDLGVAGDTIVEVVTERGALLRVTLGVITDCNLVSNDVKHTLSLYHYSFADRVYFKSEGAYLPGNVVGKASSGNLEISITTKEGINKIVEAPIYEVIKASQYDKANEELKKLNISIGTTFFYNGEKLALESYHTGYASAGYRCKVLETTAITYLSFSGIGLFEAIKKSRVTEKVSHYYPTISVGTEISYQQGLTILKGKITDFAPHVSNKNLDEFTIKDSISGNLIKAKASEILGLSCDIKVGDQVYTSLTDFLPLTVKSTFWQNGVLLAVCERPGIAVSHSVQYLDGIKKERSQIAKAPAKVADQTKFGEVMPDAGTIRVTSGPRGPIGPTGAIGIQSPAPAKPVVEPLATKVPDMWSGGFIPTTTEDFFIALVPAKAPEPIKKISALKDHSIKAAYRIAARQLSLLTKSSLLVIIRKQTSEDSLIRAIGNLLDSDIGEAFVGGIIGIAIHKIPQANDPRIVRLSQEFQIAAMALAGNAIIESLAEQVVPIVTAALYSNPEEKIRLLEEEISASDNSDIENEDDERQDKKVANAKHA